jgi:acyl-CoA synthetase (AMP-forming)/AMP-acid ligase II
VIEILQAHNAGSPAIIDCAGDASIAYGELVERVATASRELCRNFDRSLVIQVSTKTVDSIVLYLACLESGFPVCLLEPYGPEALAHLAETYQPALMLLPPRAAPPRNTAASRAFPGTAYRACGFWWEKAAPPAHPDLALLLTTSGSMGTPKLVRLSLDNVVANARSIIEYLNLMPGERSIQGLPIHYSYGLSLINSHLLAGATVVLTPHPVFSKEFWHDFDRSRCTSFAGVPYTYEALARLQFDPTLHPSLRTMTQAGGSLRPALVAAFQERAVRAGVRFFVMYGQTEATARISYVPPERLGDKIGSIGVPIPGGRMGLAPADGGDSSELRYSGPNVMMGYAESAASLCRGDELNGVLHTGDLVSQDDEGFYYMTGRRKRFAKLFGRRISLLEIENELEAVFPIQAAVVEHDQQLRIFMEPNDTVDPVAVCRFVARNLRVPPKFIPVGAVDALPRTANGKKDYKALCG